MYVNGSARRVLAGSMPLWLILIAALFTDISSNIPHESCDTSLQRYSSLRFFIHSFEGVCDNPSNNVVLPRHQESDTDHDTSWVRHWSMHGSLIPSLVGATSLASKLNCQIPLCANLSELVESVARAPAQMSCRLRWYGPEQTCAILSRFGLIWMHGDSLTRQHMQALFILASGDLQQGAYPPALVRNFSKAESAMRQSEELRTSSCRCDGQFSESLTCRNAQWLKPFEHSMSLTDIDVCADRYRREYMPEFIWSPYDHSPRHIECPRKRNNRVFVYLQAGPHHDNDFGRAWNESLRVSFDAIREKLRVCLSSTHVVVSGSVAVSASLEAKYPSAHRSNIWKYNAQLREWFDSPAFQTVYRGIRVSVINFWNMTFFNLKHTSDGFHSLSDTNVAKALVLVSAMDALTEASTTVDKY